VEDFLMVVVVVAFDGGLWRWHSCGGRADLVKTLGCFSLPSPQSHLSLVEGRLAAGRCLGVGDLCLVSPCRFSWPGMVGGVGARPR
jgi:hypothetical protein